MMSGIAFCHLYANDRSIAHAFRGTQFMSFYTDPTQTGYLPKATSIDQMELIRGGLTKVDAVIHHPRSRNWSFFSGDRYLTLTTLPSGVIERVFPGTRHFRDGWDSLVELGFSFVDAFLPVPGRPGEFFVFSGEWFGRIKFIENGDSVVTHVRQTLKDGWPGLPFDRVESAMLHHWEDGLAYFFHGSNFVCLQIYEDTTKSKVAQDVCPIVCQWPDLQTRGLYPRPRQTSLLTAARFRDGASSPAVVVTTWNTSALTVVEHEVDLSEHLGSSGGKLQWGLRNFQNSTSEVTLSGGAGPDEPKGVDVVLSAAIPANGGEVIRDSINLTEVLRLSEEGE
ncbi:CVNH domain protein [Ceratobasidium sp. AG-Ba]|nr:CVNH domain protein [Ceratobasidium sp. AG-Ba]